MAKKKMINDEPLTLEPIGEAIEKAAKRLRQVGKGDPRIKEKVEVLETAQQLLKIVCGKTYGRFETCKRTNIAKGPVSR